MPHARSIERGTLYVHTYVYRDLRFFTSLSFKLDAPLGANGASLVTHVTIRETLKAHSHEPLDRPK